MGLLKLAHDVHLETQECGECGITFAAPESFWRERRNTGRGWFCPNGHSRVFRETDVEKLRKEMQAQIDRKERERAWAAEARDRYRREAEETKRRLSAAKGQLTKTKKRIAGGVCPCCNRSFSDLYRHMTVKHPDYAALESEQTEVHQ